jgi:hypothetical protein
MSDANHHRRRVRAYEFEHVVPWEDIIADMGGGDSDE